MENNTDLEQAILFIEAFRAAAVVERYSNSIVNALTLAATALHEKSARERIAYDTVEEYPNCTVQVLTDSKTGECSVGWWKNE